MSAAPLKICPEDRCARKKWGRGPVTKKVSAGAGLLFKGNGFYITDYRSESYKSSAKKDSGAGDAKPAAKPETNPAAAPVAKPASAKTSSKK